jgi:type I restriction enzyme M protein
LLFFEKGEPTQDVWFYEHTVPAGQKAYSMTRPIRIEHFKDCTDWWGLPAGKAGGFDRSKRQETEQAWRVSLDDIKARNYNLDFKNPHTVAEAHGDPAEILVKVEAADSEAATLREQLKSILEEALTR